MNYFIFEICFIIQIIYIIWILYILDIIIMIDIFNIPYYWTRIHFLLDDCDLLLLHQSDDVFSSCLDDNIQFHKWKKKKKKK